jgi:hypothetical protein
LTPMPREHGTRWFLFYVLSNLFGRWLRETWW